MSSFNPREHWMLINQREWKIGKTNVYTFRSIQEGTTDDQYKCRYRLVRDVDAKTEEEAWSKIKVEPNFSGGN